MLRDEGSAEMRRMRALIETAAAKRELERGPGSGAGGDRAQHSPEDVVAVGPQAHTEPTEQSEALEGTLPDRQAATRLKPIMIGRNTFSFVYGPSGPNRRIASRGSIRPLDAGHLSAMQTTSRSMGIPSASFASNPERHRRGRVANTLAAVKICEGELEVALGWLAESEAVFVEILNDPMELADVARLALAAVYFNAGLVMYRAGHHADAGSFRDRARQKLSELQYVLDDDDDEDLAFLSTALEALTSDAALESGREEERVADARRLIVLQRVHSEATKSISFPLTDPPNMKVRLHANMNDDTLAVEVDDEVVAFLPTGARVTIEGLMEPADPRFNTTRSAKIPFVEGTCGAGAGDMMTLNFSRGSFLTPSSSDETYWLQDGIGATFAGTGGAEGPIVPFKSLLD